MFINYNKTYISNTSKNKTWYLIDAKAKTLGRISTEIAFLLQGKNLITYTKHQRSNVNIIIINSHFINVTGKKREQKLYKRHSGRPGGMKIENFHSLNIRMPNKILEKSIRGMLPKNKISKRLLTQLKIYADNNHPHTAQKPIDLT
uniref:Ribosomal protein L13 n=1 Tax=Anotrichium furcellatum TaxID=41999 RepID=A0A4D6WKE4_9FLOR|nr:ribosomal protein L13 [Anotrichium furcellatum]